MVVVREAGAAVVVLGFRAADPTGYGRLVLDDQGTLQAIVEDKDGSENERAIDLCNAGVMAIDAAQLPDLLARIGKKNAKGEYYLTDIVGLARDDGLTCAVIEAGESELIGVDSRADLARAEALWQSARRNRAMDDGVTLLDPDSTYFAHDTVLGRDVIVGPNVVFGPGVEVSDNVEIKAFSHIEGTQIGEGATIGPFARLRPGTEIGKDVHIGNFVELKNTVMAPGAKANHLAYVGDTVVGAKANIGAGTITCNYDGLKKHKTVIGEGAFIGSNSALVAPVKIGDGAIVGAGSTISHDVPDNALAIERSKQINLTGRAEAFRAERAADKATKTRKE
jgi:bifunctional UDP-N-acetylglucosamine pyrophosphorylase/glucosamine-1-phosphate N-acetyltransferase